MSDDRWERVADLYQAAQDRTPEERSSFVRQAAAGDPGLRAEVESLLAEDDRSPRSTPQSSLLSIPY